MAFRTVPVRFVGVALVTCGLIFATPGHARTIGLLIGIGQTDAVGIADRDARAKLMLDGPPLDVAAMRLVLERRMGARAEDVHVLVDHQASRAAILTELTALVERSQPGDTVVIYYSGHGTSQRDPDSRTGLPQGTSAWIPADFDFGNPNDIAARLISGRLDIRPLALEPLDRGGRHVIIISDSCFSGNIARGLGPDAGNVISKYVPLGDSGGVPEGVQAADFTPPAYPYAHVLMLSASADTEKAADLARDRARLTIDGKPKGALTNALLRVFGGLAPADYNRDGQVSFVELQRAVREDLAALHLAQSPQLLPALDQDPAGITFAPVPGLAAIAVAPRAVLQRVRIPDDAGALHKALSEAGDFVLVPGAAEMTVAHGASAGRFNLANGAGDRIATDAPGEAIVARLRAGSWARRVVAGASARITLAADTEPTARGGTFVIGRDSLQLAVKADQPVWYLVFDIDPDGRIVTLWPTTPGENMAVSGGSVQKFGKTDATDPAGLDHVVVLAFPQRPSGLDAFFALKAEFGSAEAQALVQWLAAQSTTYAAATLDVRTMRPCAAGGASPCVP